MSIKILILGSGYGGIRLVQDLEKGIRKGRFSGEAVLVDQFPVHQLVTELHQVASGSIIQDRASIPLEKILQGKSVTFRQARVTGFDLPRHRVLTDQGELKYDRLVIALGGETDFFDIPTPRIPGLRQHAFEVQTMQLASRAWEHFQEVIYQYVRDESSKLPLHFVVGGGGSTGVEVAGQLADELPRWCRQFDLPEQATVLHLIEAGGRLLPGFHPRISQYAEKVLRKRGVVIHLGDPIVRVEKDSIHLASGQQVPTRCLMWAGGIRGHSLLEKSGLKVDTKGRIVVNGYLQAQGQEDVYAMGDCSLVIHPHTGRACAASARLAVNEAHWLAKFFMRRKTFPFVPHTPGAVISLGKGAAVAVVGRLRAFGWIAYILKYFISLKYIYSIGGIRLILYQWRTGILGKI
ncbi:MAG: NAD(P)/FAD-dependent oxidoreductase [Nitrospiria bacterium]